MPEYIETSSIDGERKNWTSASGIKMNIGHTDQPIPPEMDELWAFRENEAQLQQFFIHWLRSTCNNEKQVYVNGCHKRRHLWMPDIAERSFVNGEWIKPYYEKSFCAYLSYMHWPSVTSLTKLEPKKLQWKQHATYLSRPSYIWFDDLNEGW